MTPDGRRTFFENPQWFVTDEGLEAFEPDEYDIQANGLLITYDDGESQVVQHMAGKRWVDLRLLGQALKAAIAHHHPGSTPPFDVDAEISRAIRNRDRELLT